MNKKKSRFIAGILIIILAFGTVSCGNKTPEKKPDNAASAQEPPAELNMIKEELMEIGIMLEKRRNIRTGAGESASPEESKASSSETTKGESSSATQEWKKEMDKVRSLHRHWNGLEPKAVAKGLSAIVQANLEESLGNLTASVENRQPLPAELAANQVFRNYIEVAHRFKTEIPSDLERVRYHVTESRLQSIMGSWDKAEEEARQSLEIWQRLAYSLEKIQRTELNQMEHSLTDLVGAVQKKSSILTEIKSEIALDNLEQLEKKIKASL
ncbi:MAG: hypothetical protein GX825_08535 [Syntrophomonadaceae bacterium]|jgi:hypothetical protein|nr:hypothetical protein [Syntrophomonadaceae bacterium]